jgi:hypothetical protein
VEEVEHGGSALGLAWAGLGADQRDDWDFRQVDHQFPQRREFG